MQLVRNQLLTQGANPVAASELAGFMGLPDLGQEQALLSALLDSAMGTAEHVSGQCLRESTYRAIYQQQVSMGIKVLVSGSVRLPFPDCQAIEAVESQGQAVPYTADLSPSFAVVAVANMPASLEVVYRCHTQPLKPALKMAVLSMAAYLYEHRGQCDAVHAAHKSGSYEVFRRFQRINAGAGL